MILFGLFLSYLCSLYVKNLERSDIGEYSCHIVNEAGEGTSVQPYVLDVYCEFSLEVFLRNVFMKGHQPVRLKMENTKKILLPINFTGIKSNDILYGLLSLCQMKFCRGSYWTTKDQTTSSSGGCQIRHNIDMQHGSDG